ncbi:MAG: stage 0 sporulation family protein [Clostridia bacterium]|nr:stage 0 sporulation family protein [Clostridia bacterium]
MTKVVSVKFNDSGKGYYFKPIDNLSVGQTVIVDTVSGNAMGTVCGPVKEVEDEKIVPPLKRVIRIANENDMKSAEENRKKEPKAFEICSQKILDHKLEMKLVDVEYSFDGGKITFFFTADGRVDFRELVKDLASHFHTRIELRQIGVRDEARMLGGLGICGYPYCCKQFLDDFQPVSIKMAKEQGLSLNPTKISGSCGRLMCCLKYEQDSYDYLMKITPSVGSTVMTDDGPAIVTDVNMITGNLLVKPKDEDGIVFKVNRKDVKILSNKKRPDDNK